MSEDINPILQEWDKDPNSDKIRMITGADGRDKIQIRIKFGLLQMESDGRPDGKRPYGKESLLEHYLSLIEIYKKEYGNDDGFTLDNHDCERLRDESIQYYHRYVTLFELSDYRRAERDTARNLRVLALLKKYAELQDDANSLEQYKPYITMMNARSKAILLMKEDKYGDALTSINKAINSIIDFYRESNYDEKKIEESQELKILRESAIDIRNKWESK
ncbi:hypothetical protein GF312_05940 [Candidatus Poribacteria bacterium]|nr:hypothetical protein [Candidatus Poribacteria bacterium]